MVRARGTKRDYSENKRNTSYTETEVMQHALAGKKFLRYLELTQGEYWQTAKHHVLLTEKLGEVEKYIATGEGIPRLAIFMPPRVGKSMVCTKTFPSWFLGRNPDRECIVISYGADLAYDFSRANRELFREYAYPIWGKELADDTQGVANWGIKGHRGGLKASGIGGAITGRGADLLLIDDPVKNAIEGASEITQQKNIEWYQSTAYTRLSPKGAVIIIMTRWNCFREDALVYTINGQRKIKDIQQNDIVLTTNGYEPVMGIANRPYRGNMIHIQPYGYPEELVVTPNHEIFTKNGWKRAEHITKDDYIAVPRFINNQPSTTDEYLLSLIPPAPVSSSPRNGNHPKMTGKQNRVTKDDLKRHLDNGLTYQQIADMYGYKSRNAIYEYAVLYGLCKPRGNVISTKCVLDPDFWEVIGLWIAEGVITYGRKTSTNVVRWCFGSHEQELANFVSKILSRHGIASTHRVAKSALYVSCSSSQLARFVELFGVGAANKHLPSWAISLPRNYIFALLRGYHKGDGCISGNIVRFSSRSFELMSNIKLALARNGIFSKITKGTISSTGFGSVNVPYELRFDKRNSAVKNIKYCIDENNIFVKIRKLYTTEFDGTVYDIETPSHNFIANHMVVHNSEDLAGKLLHLDEIGQGDHWEVVRLPALCDSQNDPVGRQIGEPLWPERFPLDWWEGRRTVETLYWEALYQQTPLDLTESIFKIEEMVTYDTRHLQLDKCKFFGACDPSAGGDDYSAISTIAVTPELEWVVYDCRLSRETQLDTINAIVAAAKEFRYDGFYIEANSLGHAKAASGSSIFEIELRRQLTEAGIALPYEFVWNSSNKEDRIRSIHPFYVNKTLQFREDWNKKYPKLMKQLQRFPHGAHDDGPDSIELAIRAIINKSRKPAPVLNIPRVIARARDVTRFGIF